MAEKRPEDAVTIAGHAVAMNPLEFPELYFVYAAANYNLKHLDVAETNARRATDLDNAHEIPRAELLLAIVLIARGDRAGALQHFRKYLEIVPKAPDADQVKRGDRRFGNACRGEVRISKAICVRSSFMTPAG